MKTRSSTAMNDCYLFRKSGKLNATGITQDIQRITFTTEEETEMDVTATLQSVASPGSLS